MDGLVSFYADLRFKDLGYFQLRGSKDVYLIRLFCLKAEGVFDGAALSDALGSIWNRVKRA